MAQGAKLSSRSLDRRRNDGMQIEARTNATTRTSPEFCLNRRSG